MDLRKLKTLIDLVSESNISELEIAEADGKVRIVKTPSGVPAAAVASPSPVAHVLAAPASAPIATAPVEPEPQRPGSPSGRTFRPSAT